LPGPDARLLERASRCLSLALAEAGALALSLFPPEPAPLAQVRRHAGERGRHRRRRPAEEPPRRRRVSRLRLDLGGKRQFRPSNRQPTWIVDPIDGTRSYLDGDDGWCMAVALVAGGRPVVAGIVRPTTSEPSKPSPAAGRGSTARRFGRAAGASWKGPS
jgi:hypothetical protein